jgi:UDP-N-acetylglucosamine 2-epimerase (non-hydrolysing)
LRAEGVPDAAIEVTGNSVIDALLWVLARLEQQLARGELTLHGLYEPLLGATETGRRALAAIERVARGERRLILITGHRRESFGGGFQRICVALAELARRYDDCELIYPVHLNPNVQGPVFAALGALPNVHLLAPLEYLPFVYLMKLATLVLTDSGGIQEEAPSLGKPVLVLRDTTERPEGVEAGTVALVGTDVAAIVDGATALLDDQERYQAMARAVNPYGDGQASARIVARLQRYANERS